MRKSLALLPTALMGALSLVSVSTASASTATPIQPGASAHGRMLFFTSSHPVTMKLGENWSYAEKAVAANSRPATATTADTVSSAMLGKPLSQLERNASAVVPSNLVTGGDPGTYFNVSAVPNTSCTWTNLEYLVARMKSCSGQVYWFAIYSATGTTAITGFENGGYLYENTLVPNSLRSFLRLHIYSNVATGDLADGVEMTPSIYCHDDHCHSEGFSPESYHMASLTNTEFDTNVATTPYIPSGGQIGVSFNLHLEANAVGQSSQTDGETSPTERCQSNMAFNGSHMWNFNGVPALTTYSDAAGSPVQQVASHIYDAQRTLYGNPGALYGLPLHRTTGSAIMASNGAARRVVCAYIYEPGLDCDEYPFGSTVEGGGWSGGDPNFFSVRYVSASQNRSAGGTLNILTYRNQAVTDGEAFYVRIVHF